MNFCHSTDIRQKEDECLTQHRVKRLVWPSCMLYLDVVAYHMVFLKALYFVVIYESHSVSHCDERKALGALLSSEEKKLWAHTVYYSEKD